MMRGRMRGCVLLYTGLCDYTTWLSPRITHAHAHRASEQQLGQAVLKHMPTGTQLSVPSCQGFQPAAAKLLGNEAR